LTAVLFSGAGLGTTGFIAAVTVSTLVVQDITGSALQAGLASATAVVGSAIGTNLIALSVPRLGRRPGMAAATLVAAVGGVVGVVAVSTAQLWLLLGSMFLIGFGQAATHLSRYAAGDMYPAAARAGAISLVVWAGTIGSVTGPALLEGSANVANALRLPELAGGYLAAAVFMGLAMLLYLVALRPDPSRLTVADSPDFAIGSRPGLAAGLARPNVRLALVALVVGQLVMVLIMTGTPIHIRDHGHGLSLIGLVIGGHTFGMFAFSPLTGKLANRFGRVPVMMSGQAVLFVAALMAALSPATSTPLLVASLFLLGLGWNLGFVSASALVGEGLEPAVRARLQGVVDGVTWTASAVAAISSGALLQVGGFQWLAVLGGSLVVIPAVALLRLRRRLGLAVAATAG
jgi:MFS family permease